MNLKKRKLLLINPANQEIKGFINDLSTRFMPIGLGIVAALTPPEWEIEFLDESFEKFRFIEADVVALTSFTSSAFRAYEIAQFYREKGVHTVLGGVHASMCTDEALEYFDTVVTCEAEGVWTDFLSDFENGTPQRVYAGGLTDIDKIPHVRRDIFNKYPYVYDLVQTSRGCPTGCDFCSVTHLSGRTYRERKVEDILDELEETTRPMIFFVDDNLVNNKKGADKRAINLFKGMVERGIKKQWLSQAALNFADNDEMLYWARKSGCTIILMGIEAENPNALKDVKKNLNLKRGVDSYKDTFRKIHRHGIGILATIIFGMESDTAEDLHARQKFIEKSSIDCYQTTILTPLPGTVLYDKLKGRNQIVLNNYPSDWQKHHFMKSTVNTSNMNHLEIESNVHEIWQKLYNKAAMRRKMFRTLWNTKSFRTAYWAYASNHNYGRIVLENVPQLKELQGWESFKRNLYISVTNKIIFLFYQLYWTRMLKKMSSKTK